MARINVLAVLLPLSSFFAGFMLSCLHVQLENYDNNAKESNIIAGKIKHQNERPNVFVEQATDYSFTEVSILCWVMTSSDNLFSRAIHVSQTWGTRCNLTLYVTDEEPDRPFPGRLLILPVEKGRQGLWGKTRAAFTYIFEHYREDFDWFLKADDDTYVILDNLRYFLHSKNISEPSYFGCRFGIPEVPEGPYDEGSEAFDYMSGGAGYVINREALLKFMSVMYVPWRCPFEGRTVGYPEDVMVGFCLMKAGVTIHSSLDSLGRSRFLPLPFASHVNGANMPKWFLDYAREDYSLGIDCCSDYLVTMHYTKPAQMYFFEFMAQHLRLASQSKEHCYDIDGQNIPI